MRGYLYMIHLSFKSSIAYKAEVWFGIFTSVLTLSIQIFLWKALFRYGNTNIGVSLESMITYFVISSALSQCFINDGVLDDISQDVNKGNVSNFLTKPYSYKFAMMSKSIGRALFSLVFIVVPMVIISCLFYKVSLPANIGTFIIAIFIALGSFYIFFSIYYIAGLATFWFIGMQGAIGLLLENILRIFSGALLPLWIFPKWLYNIASVLPIRLGFDLPISIYIGRAQKQDIINGIITQLIWFVILAVISRVMWRLATRKLVVQGG